MTKTHWRLSSIKFWEYKFRRGKIKKIYICGKVTGDPNNKEKFLKEENRLFSSGYEPVNPTVLISSKEEWQKAMKTAIRVMLLCDGVALLPDWKKSKGAKIEAKLACELGLDVREAKDWK